MGDGGARVRYARRPDDVVAASIGLVILVVCSFIVRDGRVGPLEVRVFHVFNGSPDSFFPVMDRLQLLGTFVVGPIVAVAALALRRWRLAIAAVLVTAGKLAAERLVWQIVQRARPGTTIPSAIIRGDTPTHGLSFVSGHVALATALAWIVTPYLRGWWRVVPWLVVASVGAARMYLGAHAPLDVVGGVSLGLILGGAANLLVGIPLVREPDRTLLSEP